MVVMTRQHAPRRREFALGRVREFSATGRGKSGEANDAGRVHSHMQHDRVRTSRRILQLLAIVATISCSGDRVVDAPRILARYTILERSRVQWPLSYYSDSTVVHFVHTEYLTFDDTGKSLTRESLLLTNDLVTGGATSYVVTAHMSVERKGNTLVRGAPDVCPPHADCTAGRLLCIPGTGGLIEPPGRYGSDSLVFGSPPVSISASE